MIEKTNTWTFAFPRRNQLPRMQWVLCTLLMEWDTDMALPPPHCVSQTSGLLLNQWHISTALWLISSFKLSVNLSAMKTIVFQSFLYLWCSDVVMCFINLQMWALEAQSTGPIRMGYRMPLRLSCAIRDSTASSYQKLWSILLAQKPWGR